MNSLQEFIAADMYARARARALAFANPIGGVAAETYYMAEAYNRQGRFLWRAFAKNRVVTAGLNELLDATFKTGLASPAWYVGVCPATITDAAITASAAALTSASNDWVSGDAG